MAEQAPGEPPSRWEIINDYSKTVVTLGAGLLGLIATFAEKLGLARDSAVGRIASPAAIVFSVLAIAFALLVPGRLDRYLRICAAGNPGNGGTATQEQWNTVRPNTIWWCKFWANLSYIALFLAAIALAGVALTRLCLNQQTDEMKALSKADKLLQNFSEATKPKWQRQSLSYSPGSDSFELIVLEQQTSARFKVIVPRPDIPCSIQRLP